MRSQLDQMSSGGSGETGQGIKWVREDGVKTQVDQRQRVLVRPSPTPSLEDITLPRSLERMERYREREELSALNRLPPSDFRVPAERTPLTPLARHQQERHQSARGVPHRAELSRGWIGAHFQPRVVVGDPTSANVSHHTFIPWGYSPNGTFYRQIVHGEFTYEGRVDGGFAYSIADNYLTWDPVQ